MNAQTFLEAVTCITKNLITKAKNTHNQFRQHLFHFHTLHRIRTHTLPLSQSVTHAHTQWQSKPSYNTWQMTICQSYRLTAYGKHVTYANKAHILHPET